ncbi:IS3 family transposase [Alteromonas sp. chi3]|uniref:IS3 family transposase n=1 Tax=Alteromonas gilva TaxID=2987522 RepID=A0ABT5KXQ7_9ALTE|nr:IS3 family transposase [Alteromonas gilva]MDC8829549.1 IS3 family transposase [Alteromonas gilva]
MSKKGNYHDNAATASFFSLLIKVRVKRKIYPTRALARADIFDYIEGFCNPRRNHGANGVLSSVRYEKQY